jgi:hypothetical protein
MLTPLFTGFGVIQEHDLVENKARLMESLDRSIPFEAVLACVDQFIAYAAYAGNLCSPGQIGKGFSCGVPDRLFPQHMPGMEMTGSSTEDICKYSPGPVRSLQRTTNQQGSRLQIGSPSGKDGTCHGKFRQFRHQ